MKDRSTSFSKSLEGLHHEENALDKTSPLKDKFEPAKEQDNKPGPHPVDTGKGSDMVRNDRPSPQPTPSGYMRQVPDRYAAYNKLEREHRNAGTSFEEKAKRHFEQEKNAPEPAPDVAPAPSTDEQAKKEAAEKAYKLFLDRQQQIRDQEREHELTREASSDDRIRKAIQAKARQRGKEKDRER